MRQEHDHSNPLTCRCARTGIIIKRRSASLPREPRSPSWTVALALGILFLSWLSATEGVAQSQESVKTKGFLSSSAPSGGAPSTPLLRQHLDNPRYFVDPNGKAVYLAGAHVWQNMQDYGPGSPPPNDCGGHSCGEEEWQYLRDRGNNFTRGWHWENFKRMVGPGTANWNVAPIPFLKVGSKYDLTQFDPAYFAQLKERVEQARDKGLYISIMLFEGFSVQKRRNGGENPWLGHPFHPNNTDSLGGYNVDLDNDNGGEELHTGNFPTLVKDIQEAYVEKMIAELNEYDNILWEICNECGHAVGQGGSTSDFINWMNGIAELIKGEEGTADNPKEHLVWISSARGGDNADLFNGPADVVGLSGGSSSWPLHLDPPPYDGEKIALIDSDHIRNPHCITRVGEALWCGAEWPWKMLTRGYNATLMDTVRTLHPANDPGPIKAPAAEKLKVEETRRALGQTAYFANEKIVDLSSMEPHGELAQTGYCLANPSIEYVVLQPSSDDDFWVQLPAGDYSYEWYDAIDGTVVGSGSVHRATSGHETFSPGAENRVLYILTDTPPEARLVASYVPASGVGRVELVSTNDDPLPFDFTYDEAQGNYWEQPTDPNCNYGQDNPTYLKVRYEGEAIQSCTFRASWGEKPQDCPAPLIPLLNNGTEIVILTDDYEIDSSTCEPPPGALKPLVLRGQEEWTRLRVKLTTGATIPLRIKYTQANPTPPEVFLVASYVPEAGQPQAEFWSEHDNPTPFDFYYDEPQGNYEERPNGPCNTGQNNPTYLSFRYEGSNLTECSYELSWLGQGVLPCSSALLQTLNSHQESLLATDEYTIDPVSCTATSAPLMSSDEPYSVRLLGTTVEGYEFERTWNLFKRDCAWPAGHANFCRDCGPCEAGEGDCDGSIECDSGLVCVNDVGANYGFPALIDVCEAP